MTEAQDLIERLRRYREESELSYDKLARELDVTSRNVYRWLVEGTIPGDMACKIIKAFLKRRQA